MKGDKRSEECVHTLPLVFSAHESSMMGTSTLSKRLRQSHRSQKTSKSTWTSIHGPEVSWDLISNRVKTKTITLPQRKQVCGFSLGTHGIQQGESDEKFWILEHDTWLIEERYEAFKFTEYAEGTDLRKHRFVHGDVLHGPKVCTLGSTIC